MEPMKKNQHYTTKLENKSQNQRNHVKMSEHRGRKIKENKLKTTNVRLQDYEASMKPVK